MRALCLTLSLMAALAALPARAHAQPRTADRWYVSLGIAPLRYSRFSMQENNMPARSESRLDLALGGPATLALGYGVLDVFVVELQASVQRTQTNDHADEDDDSDPPIELFDNSRSTTAVSVGPTARLLLTRSMFQPFVEAGFGFGYEHTEVAGTSFSLKSLSARAGVGGQWRLVDVASISTAFIIGFESTSGETSAENATLVPVAGNPSRAMQAREVELGGDTLVLGLDLRFTIWL
jgi:opacity protein-like surface antigen